MAKNESGVEARGAVHETSKWRKEEGALRGQTIRTEFGRDRSDDDGIDTENSMGMLKGETDDLSASISKGDKVPTV